MHGDRLARLLVVSSLALFLVGLVFRAFFYARIYLPPGEPYGVADIIEFLLGWGLIAMLGLSAVSAVALAVRGPKRNRVAAAWLVGVVVVVLVLVRPAHDLAAKLGTL